MGEDRRVRHGWSYSRGRVGSREHRQDYLDSRGKGRAGYGGRVVDEEDKGAGLDSGVYRGPCVATGRHCLDSKKL